MIRTYIGIDPSTKATGIAIIFPTGKIKLLVAKTKGRLVRDRFAGMAWALMEQMPVVPLPVAAVEAQHIRYHEKNPNAMMGVQAVAGMAICALIFSRVAPSNIYAPLPCEWKGSIPKEIHQERILKKAGLTFDSPEFRGIPSGSRSDVVDALGLAMWAMEQRKQKDPTNA